VNPVRVTAVLFFAAALACAPGLGIAPARPPAAPTAVEAASGDRHATVSWTAPSDNGGAAITGFEVAWSSGGGGTLAVQGGAATSALVSGLTDGVSYSFTVSAVNASGAGPASALSAPVVPAAPASLPAAPTITSLTVGVRAVALAWSAPLDDGGAPITSYVVTRSRSGGAFATATVSALTLTGATVVDLQNGGAYAFEVAAQNSAGLGPATASSAEVTLPDLPGAPTRLIASPATHGATLTWTAPAATGGVPLVGYRVLQREYTELTFSPSIFTQTTPTAGAAAVTGLHDGSHYTFEVVATNAAGDSLPSILSGDVGTPYPPAAPTIISTTILASGTVGLSWLEPSYDGGAPLTGYTIVATPGGKLSLAAPSASSGQVSGLDPGTSYTFQIYASNVLGAGTVSAPSASVVPLPPVHLPGAPSQPVAASGIRSVQLTFAPGSAGGGTIDGYVFSESDGASVNVAAASANGANVTAQVTSLANGKSYAFVVRAHNQAGVGPASPLSVPVITARLPTQPLFGASTISNGAAVLQWSSATAESNHPVTRYTVTQVAPPGAAARTSATTSLAIDGLTGGSGYVFTVHGTNEVGDGPESPASAPLTVCPGSLDPATGSCATTIYAIKTLSSGVSQLLGRVVTLSGVVVTGVAADGGGFFVQTSRADPAWTGPEGSGVYSTGLGTHVVSGDLINIVAAQVIDLDGEVQLAPPASGASRVTILSSRNPLPAPASISSSDIASASARAQALEAALVTLQGAIVTDAAPAVGAPGDFLLDGAALSGSLLYRQAPPPIAGDPLLSATGVLASVSGRLRLAPRSAGDLVWGKGPLASLGAGPFFTSVGHAPETTFPSLLSASISLPRTFDIQVTANALNPDLSLGGSAQTILTIPAGQLSVAIPIRGVSRDSGVFVRATTGVGPALESTVRVLDYTNPADLPALSVLNLPSTALAPGGTEQASLSFNLPVSAPTTVSLAMTNIGNLLDPPSSVTVAKDHLTASFALHAATALVSASSTLTATAATTQLSGQIPFASTRATGLDALITQAQYESLFPNRNALYSFTALQTAAALNPRFLNEGSGVQRMQELAAFLANTGHETTGGWATAPGGRTAWGLYFAEEAGCAATQSAPSPCTYYCDSANAQFPCAANQDYYGRGPLQLSWNYNYGLAGLALGQDLLGNPGLVSTDSNIAWQTAIWFWMTPQAPKPSAHDVMAGNWTPGPADVAVGRAAGFGLTIDIINGGIECGSSPAPAEELDRVGFYQAFAAALSVDPGQNLDCSSMQHY
jgi:predicted chitinase